MDMQKMRRDYAAAIENTAAWRDIWSECAKYARGGLRQEIYDSTAAQGAENLASSLLSQLTPPWSKWFGLGLGCDAAMESSMAELEKYEKIIASNFEKSNFYSEAHQSYLDLVLFGTAVIMFEEEKTGEASAFKFSSIPLSQISLLEDESSEYIVFRTIEMSLAAMAAKFPAYEFSTRDMEKIAREGEKKIKVVETIGEREAGGYDYAAFLVDEDNLLSLKEDAPIASGVFASSPFIVFRWSKIPGETYGRSPVMRCLADIKTLNKSVELVLKNASIAVAGVWQADDDGVINLDAITLEPGTIIPKAVGSAGLVPLRSGADFDISALVISELRGSINRALLADKISIIGSAATRMTATEVIERADEIGRILGATYGRLQNEFLTPLVMRAIHILKRRGEISDVFVNGREADLKYSSPLAICQSLRDAKGVLSWVETVAELGDGAADLVDVRGVARFLASAFGVPQKLLKENS
ncbi:MAG: portal protein [Alphaproteobacteria bacterium]|nr:portal protein [Alphaproteobacteria bacterium]